MTVSLDRNNFDGFWFASGTARPTYTKFRHLPVAERGARSRVKRHFTEALVDHHVVPEVLAGALARRGFVKAKALLMERLPTDPRTRTGNFGEVLASEHLRQRHGYD